MHEATTINSFRHFLDNRETFNRGEGARRRRWYRGIVRPSYSTLISRGFIPPPPLGKTLPFRTSKHFLRRGRRGGLPRTDTTLPMEISLHRRALPSLSPLPPRFQRMWVNREMDNLDEFYPEGGKGMTLTSIDFKFVKKRSRSELSNLSLPNIGPFEFLLNEITYC